jgi:hypothetical protein
MYDWYIRTADISPRLAYLCDELELERIDRGRGWTIIRCPNPVMRRALQIAHGHSERAAMNYLSSMKFP